MASKRSQIPEREPNDIGNAAGASSEFYFAGFMLVIAVLTPWYFELPINFNIMDREFNPLIFLPVIFAGIGIISLTRSVFAKARAGKFGSATVSPSAAQRGQLFRPTLRTTIDIETTGDFVFVLKCIRKTRSGDDFDGRSGEKVVWKHTVTSPAARSSQGVPASFRIPADMPRSGPEKGVNAATIRWVLSVTAPVRGVNFYAAFPIDVR